MRGVKPRSSGLLIRLSPDKWEEYGRGMARSPALMSVVGRANITQIIHAHTNTLIRQACAPRTRTLPQMILQLAQLPLGCKLVDR